MVSAPDPVSIPTHHPHRRRIAPLAALLAVTGAAAATVATLIALTTAPPHLTAQPPAPAPLDIFADACSSTNPFFVTTCYVMRDNPDEPAVVAFHNSPDMRSEHYVLATNAQVGSTWGLAWDGRYVYTAAFHKRASPFGPGGPGMVYRIDVAGDLGDGSVGDDAVEEWLDIPGAGMDNHGPPDDGTFDLPGQDFAGRTSLGDIDLDEARDELYVVNLQTRRILRYRTSDRTLLSEFDHGAGGEEWADAEARPFGLKWHKGKLYHGVVRDASRERARDTLMAYVYESDADGSGMRLVLAESMDYDWLGPLSASPTRWMPWHDDHKESTVGHAFMWPQPWLTDIEFTDDDDMLLGLRDRQGDTVLYGIAGFPQGEKAGQQAGDTLIARRQVSGGEATWAVVDSHDYFVEDASRTVGASNDGHPETGFGGLARVFGPHQVMVTSLSPIAYNSGGGIWFDIDTGRNPRREELYRLVSGVDYGKANGLGDAELLCGPPPPTPTPTPAATPTPVVIYLPYGEDECIPEKRFVDVVLVLDRSTSMLRSVEPGGQPKNEAALDAAQAFVDALALEPDPNDPLGRHDQVAVVGFNDAAWVEQALTGDRAAAGAALARIRTKTQEGTRLDLALERGQAPLDGPERIPANEAVVVVLTDGLPNRVPFGSGSAQPTCQNQECTVERAAEAVKAKGTNVYTIALGRPNDVHPLLMLRIASERHQYYYAPQPEDLAAIYRIILDTFTYCGRSNRPPPTPCVPESQHADIVLVLDTSTSMQRPTRAGRTKLAAALEAASVFAEGLSLERDGYGRQDRLALVGFNDTAWTQLSLSDDRAAIAEALDALPARSAQGTRLDLALRQGVTAWRESWHLPANRPVIVLLSDGLPNRVPYGPGSAHPTCPDQECTVLAAATAAKQAGARVFTIGLGLEDDVLRRLLEEAASDPRDYAFAPDAEDLAAIYRQVAGRVRACP